MSQVRVIELTEAEQNVIQSGGIAVELAKAKAEGRLVAIAELRGVKGGFHVSPDGKQLIIDAPEGQKGA